MGGEVGVTSSHGADDGAEVGEVGHRVEGVRSVTYGADSDV
jgi:hypothetical protein